jgi:glycosyltransferase involved in cell wall biosynthesis
MICVIIPAYNESKHLQSFLKLLQKDLSSLVTIVVNDGSVDVTEQEAKKFTPFVLNHSTNLGKGAALKTGAEFAFKYLNAEYIIMMDADEQHSPEDLPKFFQKINDDHEIILGVRSFTGMPLIPTLSNKTTSFIIKCIYGVYVPDVPSGFKALSRRAYNELQWSATGYEVEVEIAQKIAQKNMEFVTVPIKTIYPDYVRGMTLLDGFKVLLKLIGIR